jgi:hypothetical protein
MKEKKWRKKESRMKLDEKKERKVECKSCNYVCGFCVVAFCSTICLRIHKLTNDPQSELAPCILYAEEKEKENCLRCFSNDRRVAALLLRDSIIASVVILDVTLSMQIASIKWIISCDDRLHV